MPPAAREFGTLKAHANKEMSGTESPRRPAACQWRWGKQRLTDKTEDWLVSTTHAWSFMRSDLVLASSKFFSLRGDVESDGLVPGAE